ncbi:MAG: hypothetical protein U9O06_00615 [Euryarchaeota archaeon]|nr:hypothetical protein [Euryarchaeota archaeon]
MAQTQHTVDETRPERNCSEFDLLLVAIPLALLAGVGSVVFFPIPQFVGVTLGAAVAACLVGYSIYAIAQSACMSAEETAGSHHTTAE